MWSQPTTRFVFNDFALLTPKASKDPLRKESIDNLCQVNSRPVWCYGKFQWNRSSATKLMFKKILQSKQTEIWWIEPDRVRPITRRASNNRVAQLFTVGNYLTKKASFRMVYLWAQNLGPKLALEPDKLKPIKTKRDRLDQFGTETIREKLSSVESFLIESRLVSCR